MSTESLYAIILILVGVIVVLALEIGNLKSIRRYQIMPAIKLDSTKKYTIKSPVAKLVDSEGSPIKDDAGNQVTKVVNNFSVSIANAVGNFGAVTALPDGSGFEFNPGDEVNGPATGDLVYSGVVDGETETRTSSHSFELEAGAPSGEFIDADFEVEQS